MSGHQSPEKFYLRAATAQSAFFENRGWHPAALDRHQATHSRARRRRSRDRRQHPSARRHQDHRAR